MQISEEEPSRMKKAANTKILSIGLYLIGPWVHSLDIIYAVM